MAKIKILLHLLVLLVIVSCASTPDESTEPLVEEEQIEQMVEPDPEQVTEPEIIEVAPEPVVEEEPIVEDVYIPEPLDESLINIAKKNIFKAKEARAQTYYPVRLDELNNKLTEVIKIKESDPDRARLLLEEINSESEQLTLDSLQALKIACINILNQKTELLVNIHADKYTPREFEITQAQKIESLNAFEEDDFTNSLALYRTAYTSLTNLYNSLNKNMTYIDKLTEQIEGQRVEGEAIGVEEWAPIEYQKAVESYLKSQDLLYSAYDAVEGEKSLRETLFLARKAIAQANINIEVAKTDAEILALMGELEEASELTVLDREDNIISPEEWDGNADLLENPIEAEVEETEETGLEPVKLDDDVEVEFPELSKLEFPITQGKTKVLGVSEDRKSLLAEAKELWNLGIEARNNGDLLTAKDYLAKSKIFLEEYKSMAVDYIYTVVLNLDERDCLWRIAEKDEYYGDPLLWQKIWERNKKQIQDPDLIYPGWKLIIPPLD